MLAILGLVQLLTLRKRGEPTSPIPTPLPSSASSPVPPEQPVIPPPESSSPVVEEPPASPEIEDPVPPPPPPPPAPLFVAHGLTNDEPLEVNKIIRSCYENPDRKKFPDFWRKTKYPSDISLLSGSKDNADYLINEVNDELDEERSEFNSHNIRLHDMNAICGYHECESSGPQVDKVAFLDQIKRSRWYRPYKLNLSNWYYFYSITDDGNNPYYAVFSLYLQSFLPKYITLSRCYNDVWVSAFLQY